MLQDKDNWEENYAEREAAAREQWQQHCPSNGGVPPQMIKTPAMKKLVQSGIPNYLRGMNNTN